MLSFVDKLQQAYKHYGEIALLIAPRVAQLPLPIQRYDEPFLPFGKALIDATDGIVCAYVFDLPAYMVLGAVGLVALERTIDYVPEAAVTVMHGSFGSSDYAQITDENAFGVDAVTVHPGVNLAPFVERSDRGLFVVNGREAIGGTFNTVSGTLDYPMTDASDLTVQVTPEDLIYKGRLDDFQQVVRETVEQLRHA